MEDWKTPVNTRVEILGKFLVKRHALSRSSTARAGAAWQAGGQTVAVEAPNSNWQVMVVEIRAA